MHPYIWSHWEVFLIDGEILGFLDISLKANLCIQWPFNNVSLNCMVVWMLFDTVQYCKCVFFSLWLSLTCFSSSLLYCKNTLDNTYNIQDMCQLTMLSVRLLVKSRLLAVKLWGTWKLNLSFWQCKGVGTLNTPVVQGLTVFVIPVCFFPTPSSSPILSGNWLDVSKI